MKTRPPFWRERSDGVSWYALYMYGYLGALLGAGSGISYDCTTRICGKEGWAGIPLALALGILLLYSFAFAYLVARLVA
jgi:hypothetical protein